MRRVSSSHRSPGLTAALRGQRGFTLIELMVSMVVSAIVILGVFAFSTIQQTTANLHDRNVRVQQSLEGAMWSMAQDVRSAGLGFARSCSELRVYDAASGTLINPGGAGAPAFATRDAMTGQPYWVLRDGVQAHWNSSGAATLGGALGSSATPDAAADSLDVILAEPMYLGSPNVFILDQTLNAGSTVLTVRTSNMLNNGVHQAMVQQLFPPGTFVAVVRSPAGGTNPLRADGQGQCLLLQVTGDVEANAGNPQLWDVPIDSTISDFNAGLGVMLADNNGAPACPAESPVCDDWDPGGVDAVGGASVSVVPLGRLRWSRYEIDYTLPELPYLVRYDIIGHQENSDPTGLGSVNYPHCQAGQCTGAGLHLPGGGNPPLAVAVGPMVEDMQVAVGCDGYTTAGAALPLSPLPPPDPGFEEVGPVVPPLGANQTIDEIAPGAARDRDEWLGNAVDELWAPDCVLAGTAEYDRAGWVGVEGDGNPPPPFRMSPQSIRVTLVGSSERPEEAGGLSTDQVLAVEDRPVLTSSVGARQRFTLTETFSPKNLRWRDTTAP